MLPWAVLRRHITCCSLFVQLNASPAAQHGIRCSAQGLNTFTGSMGSLGLDRALCTCCMLFAAN